MSAGTAGLALHLGVPGGDPTHSSTTVGFALWSAAFVLLLVRWRPDTSWLRRIPWLDRTVAVINARAVTIYLWHDPAIVVAGALLALVGLDIVGIGRLPMVLVLTAVAMFAADWVENLAARRRVSLLPGGSAVAPRHSYRIGTHRASKI